MCHRIVYTAPPRADLTPRPAAVPCGPEQAALPLHDRVRFLAAHDPLAIGRTLTDWIRRDE